MSSKNKDKAIQTLKIDHKVIVKNDLRTLYQMYNKSNKPEE